MDDDPYIAGVSRGGDLAGYLVYDIEEGGADSGRRLVVREYGHVGFEAYRALLEFCRYHDSQVAEIELFGPVDTTIQDLVRDPHEVELAIEPGPMIRIVDVSRALSNLTYPAGLDTDLAIDVADGLADWNDGRFRLSIASGTASCERIAGDGDASDADADVDVDADSGADAAVDAKSDPDLRTSIATLSQVAVGFLPPERAERIGGFDAALAVAVRATDAIDRPSGGDARELYPSLDRGVGTHVLAVRPRPGVGNVREEVVEATAVPPEIGQKAVRRVDAGRIDPRGTQGFGERR